MILGRKSKVRAKPDGESVERYCCDCKQNATFREAELEETYSILLTDVHASTSTVWMCSECLEWGPLERSLPPKLSAQQVAERVSELEAKVERDEKRRAEEKRERKASIEDELAAIKKRLGR